MKKYVFLIILLLYLIPVFLQFNFTSDFHIDSIELRFPRVLAGDEPHYLILMNSLIDDKDFLIKNNYEQVEKNESCDAGFSFKGVKLDRRAMYTKDGKDYTLNLIYLDGSRRPGKENVDLEEYTQVTLVPIGLPLFSALLFFPLKDSCAREHFAIFFSLIVSLIGIYYVYKVVLHYTENEATALLTVLAYALGTEIWHYSKTFFTEPYLATVFIVSYYLIIIKKKDVSAGLLLGAGYLMKQTMVIPFLIYFVYYIYKKEYRRVMCFTFTFMIVAIIFVAFNYVHFGTFTTPAKKFTYGDSITGLYKNLFSPITGLFPFSPLLLLSFFGVKQFYKKNKEEFILLGTLTITYSALMISFAAVGGAYASRYLLPVIPFMMVLWGFAYSFSKYKRIAMLIILVSFLINLQAALIYPLFWDNPPWIVIKALLTKSDRIIEVLFS